MDHQTSSQPYSFFQCDFLLSLRSVKPLSSPWARGWLCVCCAPARWSLGCQGSGALSLLWGWCEAAWWQRHVTWMCCSCPAQMGCGGAPFETGSHSGGCSIFSKFCELDLSVLKLPRLGLILHVFRCISRKVSLNSKKSSLLGDVPSLPWVVYVKWCKGQNICSDLFS